jgi:hypothetical protein
VANKRTGNTYGQQEFGKQTGRAKKGTELYWRRSQTGVLKCKVEGDEKENGDAVELSDSVVGTASIRGRGAEPWRMRGTVLGLPGIVLGLPGIVLGLPKSLKIGNQIHRKCL